MRVPRKVLIGICAPLVLLLVAAPAAVWFLLNPDTLKARAAAYVKEQTGRDLVMNGPVSLSFYPWLGAELRGVELAAPPGFDGPPFAAIDELGVKVKVLPLLGGDVVVDRIVLNGFRIHAVARRDGRTSFDFSSAPTSTGGAADSAGSSVKSVRVEGVSVRRAELTYTDEASGSRFALKDLELTTGPFGAAEPTDVTLAFNLSGIAREPARVTMTGRMTLDVPRSQAELADLTLKMRESTMTGRVTMGVRQKPAVRFDLSVDAVDLDQYLPAAGAPASTPAQAAASADPFEALRTLEAEGSLRLGRLRAIGLQFSEIATAFAASNGVATVGPTTAKLYGGRSKGILTLDARERVPSLQLDQQLTHVSIAPLLADLQLYKNLSGTGDVTLRVSARGAETAAVTKSLDGWAAIALRDGRIEGADFLKLITEARAVAGRIRGRNAPAEPAPGGQTAFAGLSASATIEDGVARSTDLVLDSPSLHATGSGALDLGRERIDYVLRASSPQAGNVEIPIAITGLFAAPSYRVQAGAMVKEAAKKEVGKQIQKGLGGLFKKKGL
jgi:AsmA protein